jgi:predicted membrane protein (TIGR00267 family)
MIIPVVPFTLFANLQLAMTVSLIVALATLFALGALVGKLGKANLWRFGLRYVLLGLAGAALAFVVGDLLKDLLTVGYWIPPW